MGIEDYCEEFAYFNMHIKEEIRDDDFLEEKYFCNECSSEDMVITKESKFCLDCGWSNEDLITI